MPFHTADNLIHKRAVHLVKCLCVFLTTLQLDFSWWCVGLGFDFYWTPFLEEFCIIWLKQRSCSWFLNIKRNLAKTETSFCQHNSCKSSPLPHMNQSVFDLWDYLGSKFLKFELQIYASVVKRHIQEEISKLLKIKQLVMCNQVNSWC